MEWCSYKGFSHNSHNFILQTPDSAVAQDFLQGLWDKDGNKKETWNYWSFLILISDYQFLLIVQDKENGVYLCLLSISISLVSFEATTMLLLGCQSDVQPESGQHQIRGDYVTLSRSCPRKNTFRNIQTILEYNLLSCNSAQLHWNISKVRFNTFTDGGQHSS